MKIKQFRSVLEKVAVAHSRLGASESASALRALAVTLKPRDNSSVGQFVDEVKNLRETGGKGLRQKRESA